MITRKVPPPPAVHVAAPEVKVSPVIHVAPSTPIVHVQALPPSEITVETHKPCKWSFAVTRTKEGFQIEATPRM
jgi:hypothetical protein